MPTLIPINECLIYCVWWLYGRKYEPILCAHILGVGESGGILAFPHVRGEEKKGEGMAYILKDEIFKFQFLGKI